MAKAYKQNKQKNMSNIINDIEMCTSSRKSEVSHQERKR